MLTIVCKTSGNVKKKQAMPEAPHKWGQRNPWGNMRHEEDMHVLSILSYDDEDKCQAHTALLINSMNIWVVYSYI